MHGHRRRRTGSAVLAWLIGLVAFAAPAAAHGGGLGAGARTQLAVPTWLVVATGGAAVGASFLLASFLTDRSLVRALEAWSLPLGRPPLSVRRVTRTVGVLGLALVLLVAFLGPAAPANLAILLVWVGWWAGFTVTTYLVGNAWPLVNPWRAIASVLPTLDRRYPLRLGAWPATVALLVLVWIEIASPLAAAPRLLGVVVLGYTAVTLAGCALVGPADWFRWADPVSRVFRAYGAVAPVGDGGLRLPGTGLDDVRLADWSEVAFAVALLWATTFDGLVATAAWRGVATAVVGAGLPPWLLYPIGMAVGFGLFFGLYVLAVRLARTTGETYRSTAAIARDFAPSLFAIAAGYHLAHYLPYFLSTVPGLVGGLADPLAAPAVVPTAALPAWFGGVGMVAVLLGHVVAVWAVHARSFERFPDRLQAIRSQYPLVGVMVCYTMTSLWILAQPTVAVVYT